MLNWFEEGIPIVVTGKKTVYLSQKPVEDGFSHVVLKGDSKFTPAIDKETERSIGYITAPSGSGKSWYSRMYIEAYHKAYPKRSVYVFSSLNDDKTLDILKYLIRLDIRSDEFLTMSLDSEDFKDCLVLFDDTDCLVDKAIKKKVNGILTSVLETGRHFNTSVLYTSHLSCTGHDSKRILNEASFIVTFPQNMSAKSLKYLYENYLGMDRALIQKILSMQGRWVTTVKSYPQVIFSENEVFIKGKI